MNKQFVSGVPLVVSLLILSACSGSPSSTAPSTTSTAGGAAPVAQDAAPVMQPLQEGQPPQKPPKNMFVAQTPTVQGGNPGTNPIAFNQPFTLADLEYLFITAKGGKNFVGLEASPSMKPTEGNTYFLVRYQVTDHGAPITVPNNTAVHLMNTADKTVVDIDQAATNANVQSGAATGMPNQLSLNTEEPQIQTLVFQLPATTDLGQYALLVTELKDPTHVFQLVNLSN